jgi:hypothetical protein
LIYTNVTSMLVFCFLLQAFYRTPTYFMYIHIHANITG